MYRTIIFLTLLLLHSSKAFPYEVLEICATYTSTNKKYKVETSVLSGTELNSKTNSYNYQTYSKYAVIFWDQGQASVIELDYSFGGISHFGTFGKDQQGNRWELSQSTSFCY